MMNTLNSKEDFSAGFSIGLAAGMIAGIICTTILFCASVKSSIILNPVEDRYKDEILYYIDTKTNKTYKLEGDIIYYRESEEKE